MSNNKQKKQIKDYINIGMRKLRNRKGYGVHSPFAFNLITEVIEEKMPYYAYQQMQRLYPANGPLKFKVAALMFRLANRFKSRNIAEIGCDGGYTLLPLLLVDSRTQLTTLATPAQEAQTRQHLAWYKTALQRVRFVQELGTESRNSGTQEFRNLEPQDLSVSSDSSDCSASSTRAELGAWFLNKYYDFVVVNSLPEGMSPETLASWIESNLGPEGILLVRGIQPRQKLEALWDLICDNEEMQVTIDLYDYGLAIRRPQFFKQHYVVSF